MARMFPQAPTQLFRYQAFKFLHPPCSPEVFQWKQMIVWRHFGMKPDYPFCPGKSEKEDEITAPPSRFIDEKISDESGTESNSDSAMKPAGLNNPFWN
jgi:hypothetical protein